MPARDPKIVQAAGDLHDQIGNACGGQAQNIFDYPTAFHAGQRVFNHDPHAREQRVEELLTHAQLFTRRLFFGCVVNVAAGS
jgi:hypothetical protein